ncbi:MAG: hypothetical protein FWH54_04340 [Methanobrevibacter sp.]|nr:hypothetical protein [Methanobrevibacter sp.]
MFNNRLMKILGACLFLFIICFSLTSYAYAGEVGIDKDMRDEKSLNEVNQVRALSTVLYVGDDLDDPDYDLDDSDDDSDYDDLDDYDDDYDLDDYDLDYDDLDDSDLDDDEFPYYRWEWNGVTYYIDLDEFNLTDEELTELFTQRDDIREKIAALKEIIEKMEVSRNEDILLAIDELYEAINEITNNSEFNDLLVTLKDINITELNSSFNDLKKLLESIKEEYPDEDFTEIDLLVDNLESLINEELELYENLNLELKDNLAELEELYEKYPFLDQQIIYDIGCGGPVHALEPDSKNKKVSSKKTSEVSLVKKNTGIPFFSLALLFLLSLFSLSGLNLKRKF